MAAAVTWLAAPLKLRRAYYVHGVCAVLRDDVVSRLTGAVEHVVRFDAREASAESVWEQVDLTPLASERGTRAVVISHVREWARLDRVLRFLDQRAAYAGVVLVLVSDAEKLGTRVYDPDQHAWTTRYEAWETRLQESSVAQVLSCPVPDPTVLAVGGKGPRVSPAARWLSLRLPISQRGAEVVFARAGGSAALARDVVESLRLAGVTDARDLSGDELRSMVDTVLGASATDDFAEALLFGRTALALRSADGFERAEWRRILSYLAQRLDWLQVLHDALATDEELGSVQKRLGIHQKWILTYANRQVASANIAKRYTKNRVAHARGVLARCSAVLERHRGVPVGFGEVLAVQWAG